MSLRRHQYYGDDASRPSHRDHDAAAPSAHRPSREATGSSATPGGSSSPSVRGTNTYHPTSHVRNDNAQSRLDSLSEPRISRDALDIEQEGPQPRKRSTPSLTKDQGSLYPKEGEGIILEDEVQSPLKREACSLNAALKPQFRPPKDEGQHRDASHGRRYSSPRENPDINRPPSAHAKDVQPINLPSASFQNLYEAQSREINDLKHERRVALEENNALSEALAALRQQYDERSKKLNIVRHERQAALAQRKEIDDAYVALRQQYDEQTKKLNAVRHERQVALEQKQKAEDEHAELMQKYEAQKSEYNALSNKYHSLKVTLEQRTSELQGAQRFLTTADTFSGSEVVNMLRKLNEEVQQSTTFMAEWAVENFVLEALPSDQITAPIIEQTRSLETLGMRFMQLLGTKKHKDNPILVEMAFRAYLVYELYWVASPWSIGQEEQSHNMYIDAIYERMREAEGQAVSGNWRALMRTYTLPACISDPEVVHAFETTIVSGFSDILVAAGCTTSKTEIASALWSKFGEKIHHFVSLAGQVNKIIGVGVISEDFEVLVIWPDVAFDERAMEDAYDNGDRVRGADREEMVLCATELGLMQRMKVGAGSAQKGKPSELIVVKPKVALVSVLDIIDG